MCTAFGRRCTYTMSSSSRKHVEDTRLCRGRKGPIEAGETVQGPDEQADKLPRQPSLTLPPPPPSPQSSFALSSLPPPKLHSDHHPHCHHPIPSPPPAQYTPTATPTFLTPTYKPISAPATFPVHPITAGSDTYPSVGHLKLVQKHEALVQQVLVLLPLRQLEKSSEVAWHTQHTGVGVGAGRGGGQWIQCHWGRLWVVSYRAGQKGV